MRRMTWRAVAAALAIVLAGAAVTPVALPACDETCMPELGSKAACFASSCCGAEPSEALSSACGCRHEAAQAVPDAILTRTASEAREAEGCPAARPLHAALSASGPPDARTSASSSGLAPPPVASSAQSVLGCWRL